ncbi:MAG: carbohydrate ABC transporter permease [Candidatus Bathyarchaeia archaeon]
MKIKPEDAAKLLAYICVISIGTTWLFPIFWAFSSAFKYDIDIFNPAMVIPPRWTLDNFKEPYFKPIFLTWIGNSFIVSGITTVIVILISVPAGHILARARSKFYHILSRILIFAYLFPSTFLVVGFIRLLGAFGMLNSYLGVVLAYVAFNAPYVIYLVYSYMFAIPEELEEALLVDGYTKFHVLTKLIFPLSFPVIVTGVLWTFMQSWNEVLYALVILSSPNLMTAPIGMATLQPGESITPWGTLWAFSLIYSIPPLIVFYALQQYYITGIMRGAVKAA